MYANCVTERKKTQITKVMDQTILSKKFAEDGIRTRASEEIGALNRRLRPTRPPPQYKPGSFLNNCTIVTTLVVFKNCAWNSLLSLAGSSGIRTPVYRFRVCCANRYTNKPTHSVVLRVVDFLLSSSLTSSWTHFALFQVDSVETW